MTTIVTVKANHGWPVEVQQLDPKTRDPLAEPQIVQPGETRDFCVHSSADLQIHEIQPNEIAEPPAEPVVEPTIYEELGVPEDRIAPLA